VVWLNHRERWSI